MADIYRSAKVNLVYLGESDERTGDVFEMIERVDHETRRKTYDFPFYKPTRQRIGASESTDEKLDCELDEGDLLAFFNDHGSIDKKDFYEHDMGFLLLIAQYRECSDPRDKVFAILSMAGKESSYSPEIPLLEIQYRKPCHEVMRDATRYAIQELNTLKMLVRVSHRGTGQGLNLDGYPSWAVRIDRRVDETYDPYFLLDGLFDADAGQAMNSGYLKSYFVGPAVLCVNGYVFSCILEVSDVFEPSSGSLMTKMPHTCHANIPGIEVPFDMVLTIILGLNYDDQKASMSDILGFAMLLEKLMAYPSDPLEGDEERTLHDFEVSLLSQTFLYRKRWALGYHLLSDHSKPMTSDMKAEVSNY
ncbi:hypothetical protein F5Y10DRAFT_285488 [Nemania abortiva]|nr:hypothetical protein F5Y10DRAFT_285488 [Nemania abortiva]